MASVIAPTGRAPAGRDDRRSAIVVGGSLSGLLTALALARIGVGSVLLERASTHRSSGAALAADAGQLGRVIGRDQAKRVLERLGSGHDAGSVPAAWQDLHSSLRDLALEDPVVDVRHDTRVVSVGQNAAGAWATTAGGATVRGDVLVGADGYRSIVRRTMFPDHAEASYAGYALWRGVVHETDVDVRPWPGMDMLSERGFIMFGYPLPGEEGSQRPGERRLGWAWYDATRDDLLHRAGAVRRGVVEHSLTAGHVPDETARDLISVARRTWPAPWPRVIAATVATGGLICTPISEYVPDRMAEGRVVLVGDAAHVATPMTGAGFGAALADAGALAAQLAGADEAGIHDALGRYEDTRLHHARRTVLSGQGFSRSFAAGAA